MFKSTLILAMAALVGSTTVASAGSIDRREHRQAHRIYHGIANGSLSFHEARALVRGQVRIHAMERMARADGIMTPYERWKIQSYQDWQSARIWQKKHN